MATVDYFLQVDGIAGESHDARLAGAIQLLSWHWVARNSGTMQAGGGGGAGRAQLYDFHFTMPISKATPKLVQRLADGEHIPRAVLICRKAGKTPQEYLKVTFEDCIVASYATGSAESRQDGLPREGITLNFARVTMEYREQRADGTLGGAVTASHDLKQNRTQ